MCWLQRDGEKVTDRVMKLQVADVASGGYSYSGECRLEVAGLTGPWANNRRPVSHAGDIRAQRLKAVWL